MNYETRIETGGETPPEAAAARALAEAQGADPAGFEPDLEIDPAARRRRRLWIGGAVAAVALLGGLVWMRSHKGADQAAPTSQAASVSVVVPGRTMVKGTINATGTLAAKRELPVGSVGDGGQVAEVPVDAGQWVKAGQVLATIDRSVQVEQLANNQAQIGVADADARLAQANLDRALKLVDRGFISRADVDRLTATRDAANARVRVARAQYGESGAKLRRLTIVAPADGLLLERNVDPGQVVGGGGTVLFRIAKGGEMELRARLSETDLAQLGVGEEASVTPVGSAVSHVGHIWQLAPVIDPQTRQGIARIALPYARDLRPGGFAGVAITSGMVSAPMLPESALQSDNAGSYVFVVGPKNKVERRAVTVGMVTDKGIAVTAGLSGNERVVERAGAFLSAGETVNPVLAQR